MTQNADVSVQRFPILDLYNKKGNLPNFQSILFQLYVSETVEISKHEVVK